MKSKELLEKISSLEERIRQLEECINIQDNLIQNYEQREKQVSETATKLGDDTIELISDAEAKASGIIMDAEKKADEIISDAQKTSNDMLEKANNKRKQTVEDVERIIKTSKDTLNRFRALLENSAKEAYNNSQMYADFLNKQTDAFKGIDLDVLKEEFNEDYTPSSVMHNIYRIQMRDVPEEPEPTEQDFNIGHEPSDSQFPDETSDMIPKVSEIVSGCSEETSLDDLLDEIIKTGDIVNNEQK